MKPASHRTQASCRTCRHAHVWDYDAEGRPMYGCTHNDTGPHPVPLIDIVDTRSLLPPPDTTTAASDDDEDANLDFIDRVSASLTQWADGRAVNLWDTCDEHEPERKIGER
jgi:hypothetical protein